MSRFAPDATTRTALVTGASRGLGLALARELARRGWNLIIDARGVDALKAMHEELSRSTRVIALPGDVTDPAHRQSLVAATYDIGPLSARVAPSVPGTPRISDSI